MQMTYTGRGVPVTDDLRSQAEHKMAPLQRLEPRLTTIDLEFIREHHPKPDALTRVEAAARIPRKTFRAHAEAADAPTALDEVRAKLERQLRDHHGKRRASHKGGVGSPSSGRPLVEDDTPPE